jgi:hypothetical protein
MKPLYIFDLDETTGIYYSLPNINNLIYLREGFKEILKQNCDGELEMVIATRGESYYVSDIKRNLKARGIELLCKTYCKDDVSVEGIGGYFKKYGIIYKEHSLDSPAKDSIIIGDLLRIGLNGDYMQEDLIKTDFKKNPFLLYTNYSLNDYPYPLDEYLDGKTPIYVVLPRPILNSKNDSSALDLSVVMKVLEKMYKEGENDFIKGFDRINEDFIEKVETEVNVEKLLGIKYTQKYLIIKGEKEHWKPLIRIM